MGCWPNFYMRIFRIAKWKCSACCLGKIMDIWWSEFSCFPNMKDLFLKNTKLDYCNFIDFSWNCLDRWVLILEQFPLKKSQVQKLLVVFPWSVHGGDCGSRWTELPWKKTASLYNIPLKINSCKMNLPVWGGKGPIFSGKVFCWKGVYHLRKISRWWVYTDLHSTCKIEMCDVFIKPSRFLTHGKKTWWQDTMLPLCVCWIMM